MQEGRTELTNSIEFDSFFLHSQVRDDIMKSLLKNSLVVAAALLATSTIVACVDETDDPDNAIAGENGSLGLDLSVANGQNVSVVSYEIRDANGVQVTAGDIPLGSSPNVSMRIGGLPEGVGYQLILTANSDEGGAQCSGEETFDVTSGQVTAVSVVLSCAIDPVAGDLDIDAELNTCPVINSTVVHPLSAEYGELINFRGLASDADVGDTISYSWSVDGVGVSSDSTGTWACGAPQEYKDLLLTVRDGICEDSSLVQIWCQAPGVCGNGVLESGEECDDGNTVDTDSCPNTCIVPVCGDGVIAGAETCEPPGTASCDDSCQVRGDVCGDGFVTGDEDCETDDLVNGDAQCNADCSFREPVCGDGFITGPSETCEPGLDPNVECDPVTCTPVEYDWYSQACTDCAAATCDVFLDPAPSILCPPENTACRTVSDCMFETECVDPVIGAAPCYCGSLDQAACWNDANVGQHDGTCADIITDAFGGALPSVIALQFVDPAVAGGGEAGHSVNCLAQNCYDSCF